MTRRTNHKTAPRGSQGWLLALVAALAPALALAQAPERSAARDLLSLEATVTAPVTPDTATVLMSAERQGADAAAATSEVNQLLTAALREAKATPGVQASSAGFSTWPRYDAKGQRTGWVVRGDLLLKSRDFAALGKLAGRLASTMTVQSNGFEVSAELKDREEQQLIERGLAAFRAKAATASRALGYSSFTVSQVNLGAAQLQGGPGPRPVLMQARAMVQADAAPMPIEGGQTLLSLTVNGTVLMR